ncbi:MAG: 50S ribosomal protein L11 [Candidatus Heimdallarchaeota archaeon]|nr:50S ribosomal protein L11 [Candidatus Heimdallarchaeota archaeon]MCK5049239.1 50S ribosomal protein L11 [Candidatus Heimdallarchaeota archaeon]
MSANLVEVDLLVEGGKASPGGALAPQIGPTGANLMEVVKEINAKTSQFEGMKVPVKVIVDKKKRSFELEVGIPPASALLFKEAGITKGANSPGSETIANLTIEQIIKVAKAKIEDMSASSIQSAVLELLGTMVSAGMSCNDKTAKEVQQEIHEGIHSALFN